MHRLFQARALDLGDWLTSQRASVGSLKSQPGLPAPGEFFRDSPLPPPREFDIRVPL